LRLLLPPSQDPATRPTFADVTLWLGDALAELIDAQTSALGDTLGVTGTDF
jgi:hypothetical protein